MRKVSLDDVSGIERYAKVRDDARRRIIEIKRHRRIPLGDRVTLVFENFDTVLYQIQEMCLVERIVDIDKVREEIRVYNELLPSERELSATLLIEVTDPTRIVEDLHSLVGIDECVRFVVNGKEFPAHFAPGQSTEDRLSAVQYVRFALSEEAASELARAGSRVEVKIEHPRYRAGHALSEDERASLARDLAA
ncbi:MAG: DUF3501 family protein [Deltaproteobacteria bacterium]|nr:DUF3501 family protein [Deltaproteobacteria bacterium]